jgi:DNA-binding HxlR family transcriptional regulator
MDRRRDPRSVVSSMTLVAIESARREVTEFQMIRGTRAVIELLAGKWTVEVLYLLASGTRRYIEVFNEVGEVSKKTLTQTLRALERDGLIVRRVYAEVPPRVEYSLTPLGWSLTGTLMAMYEWAAEHLHEVEAARALADGEPAPARLHAVV